MRSNLVLGSILVGMCAAFALGRFTMAPPDSLQAQGRGSGNNPTGPADPKPDEPLVYGGDAGQSGSANGFIAVTGSYGVGTSVLYVLDTVTKQLAVYEARGGSAGSRRLYLVGARKIDLDLQLQGYNDESEYEYSELKQLFERNRRSVPGSGKTDDAEGKTSSGRK